jgi:hypothetical protein
VVQAIGDKDTYVRSCLNLPAICKLSYGTHCVLSC